MKCFVCKTKIGWAHRAYFPARSMREKAQFRDLCDPCFIKHQHDKGYIQTPEGHWEKSRLVEIAEWIKSIHRKGKENWRPPILKQNR
jgi:hypothetical protein